MARVKQAEVVTGMDGKTLPKEFLAGMAKGGWKPRGSVPLSWEKGMEVEGTFVKLQPREGETGAILTLDVVSDNGEISRQRYWAPTILANRLETDFEPAEQIFIVCLGKVVPTKRGQDAWGFEVFGK